MFLFGRDMEAARWAWAVGRTESGRAGRQPVLQAR